MKCSLKEWEGIFSFLLINLQQSSTIPAEEFPLRANNHETYSVVGKVSIQLQLKKSIESFKSNSDMYVSRLILLLVFNIKKIL